MHNVYLNNKKFYNVSTSNLQICMYTLSLLSNVVYEK
jgi:hypothetical protein